MDKENLFYLADTMSSLSGIPVRVYRGKKKVRFSSNQDFPFDPFERLEEQVPSTDRNVTYLYTEDWYFYVCVRSEEYSAVLGPTRFRKQSIEELKKKAFESNLSEKDMKRYVSALENLVPYPLESVLQIALALNLFMNGERRTLKDVLVPESVREEKDRSPERKETEETDKEEESAPHNTLDVERKLLSYVEQGNLPGLKSFFHGVSAVRPGILSENAMRERKNLFIVTATLVSRSAIRGGLGAEEALTLSDLYIRKAETSASVSELTRLQIQMVEDYTGRVSALKDFPSSELAAKVADYVLKHLSGGFTLEDVASALYLSRSRLCALFKKETGIGVKEYATRLKIREAKRLLAGTERSPSQISSYLSFSSQSYFNAVFKKVTGLSPREYRKKYRAGEL